jgi:hypothetical protein
MLFYREVMPKRGWNTFDTISVKWNHQVVATRRTKAVQQTIEANPDDDEQAPDIQTMTVGTVEEAQHAEKQEQTAKKKEAEKTNQNDPKKEGENNKKKNN